MSVTRQKKAAELENNSAIAPYSKVANQKKRKIHAFIEQSQAPSAMSSQATTPAPATVIKIAVIFIPRQLQRITEPARVSKNVSAPLSSTISSKQLIHSFSPLCRTH